MRNRVSRRIFGLFVGCALIPLCALSLVSYTHISRELHSNAARILRQSAKATGMTVFESLLVMDQDIEGVVSRIQSLDKDSVAEAIKPSRDHIASKFSGIGLFTPREELLSWIGTPPSFPELDVKDLAHLEEGKLLIKTRAMDDRWADILVIRSCAPWLKQLEDPPLLIAKARRSRLWGGESLLSEGFEFLALDQDNQVVYSTRPEMMVTKSLGFADAEGGFDWFQEGGEFLADSWKLHMVRKFRASWRLIYSQPKAQILAALYRFRHTFLLVAILSFLIVILLSISQIRRRLMPIQQLLRATERVGKQDFDCRVDIDTNDEFERLGIAFNTMVDRLEGNLKARDHAERELVDARDKALVAAQTEARFIANVSHELRTPMTSIRAFAEILREHGAEDQATHDEFLDIIVVESDRLTRLIENVLNLTKIQSMAEPNFELIDVAQTVSEICLAMSVVAADRGIKIDDDGVQGPLWADGDQDFLKQVWTNLLSNATKFSPDNSTIWVTAERENDHIVVKVRDQGPGISAENQAVIFERFRQVSSDIVTNKPSGTGLGLTIAKDIVQLHRGDIGVESKPGEGATFRVSLPVSFHSLAQLPGPPG